MFDIMEQHSEEAVIKVIGVGGGGGNAVEHMVKQQIEGVRFIAANTDAQALRNSSADITVQLGTQITSGLGAGANPDVGRKSAEEDADTIRASLEGADMVFIAAGMGGGTGTGAAPVVAKIAKELGILTVAVVTRPFDFEGKKRAAAAEQGINELSEIVDSLITIPNNKLLKVLGKGTTLLDAFAKANDVLFGAVQGIAELITRSGLINVDFADVRTVMSAMGTAMMGTASASGPDRAQEAAEAAISSPLLEDVDLTGAKGILVNITAGMDIAIEEFEIVGNHVKALASENATVVVGAVIDPEMTDELRVTVVATGLGGDRRPQFGIVDNGFKKASGSDVSSSTNQTSSMYVPSFASQGSGDEMTAAPAIEKHESSKTTQSNSGLSKTNDSGKKSDKSEGGDYFDIPAFLRKQAD
ncbi:cell division protein FtsZ [Pseudoalteromonas sp. SR44-5]|uniref:Cell division protein FtsZ n=1 Tax=Pseudoalteromonas rhizosphaerae TaxID=2518973 RepID=A0ABW8L073_9GAMM|nr:MULTISPECIES: cell division protein FtsZ [Pseudoalteromonas]MBB1333356.1 cell division protein FtsZ [Pseudoalteromonas sp. SR41-6]MBB1341278.1 cell division protein FtsZ [Pseudoalteromonas sp. SR45-6]MBB1366481.1 cell division protein FtsZ [Pseudoalteromonas sp. SR44-5]MBB1417210.1 cell division protein FtsZ [Pseudoalteromonas sp. SG44-1]MBB1423538.1 cell division protein FtsZ [Pseudoalteromonas sp. SG43-7]